MKTYILIFLFFTCPVLNAQVTQQWAVPYNGSGNNNDESVSIVHDSQDNVIVTGRVISTGNNNDFGTVKYNSAGALQWAQIYDGASNDYDEAVGLVVDNADNIYVAGQSLNAGSDYDIVLVKYNPAGTQLWVKIWAGSSASTDVSTGIAIDNSGNIYITGFSTGNSTAYITIKYNSNGDFQWSRTYNYSSSSFAAAYYVETDNAGNCYVTGSSTAPTTGSDFLTIKYNANGDSSWVARYSGTTASNEIPQGFAVDNSGNVYVTGFSTGTSSGIDYVTIKYNSNGVQQWLARYTSPQSAQDIPEDLEVDGSGNVYVTGRTRINSSYNDFGTVKYNSSGVQEWVAVYNNTKNSLDDYGYDLTLDGSSNVYVTGYSNTDGSNSDAITIKYDNAGNQKWIAQYMTPTDAEGFAITLDSDDNVYVAGYEINANADYLVIKYSQTVGINQISGEVPSTFSLKQNYPNPFNPVTKIRFDVTSNVKGQTLNVLMKVYNSLGSEVGTLVNEKLNAGSYEVEFDAAAYPSGIYFYRLQADDFSEVKRMTLLK